MIKKEREGVAWLEFELLADEPALIHACFLKGSGFPLGGKGHQNVNDNRRKASRLLGLSTLFVPHICHSADVFHVTEIPATRPKCDAVMTTVPGIGLLVTHADCQPAIFYDPINQAVANVHSGWRSSVANIYANTIEQMGLVFGTKPENLLVCIGPSLGPHSAEFVNYQQELPEWFWEYQIKPLYFDFWAISRKQLEECGILKEHIQFAEIDTLQSSDICYSHRAQMTERMGTVAGLGIC